MTYTFEINLHDVNCYTFAGGRGQDAEPGEDDKHLVAEYLDYLVCNDDNLDLALARAGTFAQVLERARAWASGGLALDMALSLSGQYARDIGAAEGYLLGAILGDATGQQPAKTADCSPGGIVGEV